MISVKGDFNSQIKGIETKDNTNFAPTKGQPSQDKGFMDLLVDGLDEVNKEQKNVSKMATDLASGKSENIHETMVALSHAELNFKFLVQVRNKVLEAYQDVMRMPV